jgi:DNA-binding XRE family transcriptional regulator
MPAKTSALTPEQIAARVKQPEFRAEERSIREALDRERREEGGIATTGVPTEPEDAITTARFIGALRQHREQAGLSLGDVADRSGIDKASLSRLENGWYPNPTVQTLTRYARAIGKRLILDLGD